MRPGCRAKQTLRPAASSWRSWQRCASIALIAAGCGGERPGGAPIAVARAPQLPRWDRLEEARSWPVAAPPFPVESHGAGAYVATVHVAGPFLERYRGLVAGERWPSGMAVAAFEETRAGEPASVYAMIKRSETAWDYFVVRPDGVLEAGANLALCARCHAEARADYLFGIPEPPAESSSPASRSSHNPPPQ